MGLLSLAYLVGLVELRSRHAYYSFSCLTNNTQFINVVTTISETLYNEFIEIEIIPEIKQEMHNE
ncbi:hypothetical protein SGA02_18760 [Staphylococcus gallinarum]|uniref:Uncharacterized protein n=1 Tax=Staphylococcus gallinarum TaxID=1293 RepID=A0ABQ0Y3T7_STAGA|nr:hypothetical protein SGA02_18760 [Staphylococcus gallinarum]